jgi:hypothetical protein
MIKQPTYQLMDWGFTLKNTLIFATLILILYQGQVFAISKLNHLVPVQGELVFPTALPPSTLHPQQGGSPQSMVDQDPKTWFYHDLAWGNGFVIELRKTINLGYLEIKTDELQKLKGLAVYISKNSEWTPVKKIKNNPENLFRVPIGSRVNRVKLEFRGTSSQGTLIRINELTLMAQAEIDNWNIFWASGVFLVLFNAIFVGLRKNRHQIVGAIFLISFVFFYGFGRVDVDVSKVVEVDYESGYKNRPSSGLFHGTLFHGFDYSKSTGVLLHLASPGYIDYKLSNLPNLSHSQLKTIVVQTNKERPPVEILVELDNGLKKLIKGLSHPSWVEFPVNFNLNLAHQLRIRFLKGALNDYVRVKEIELYLNVPAYSYVEQTFIESIETAFSQPYIFYTCFLLIYFYIVFSRNSRFVDLKRKLKNFFPVFLEGASYFWYSLGIIFFIIYLSVIQEHDVLWRSMSGHQLKNIIDVRPEIQISILFIFIALVAQLFLEALQKRHLILPGSFSLSSVVSHALVCTLFFLLFHVHFFVYINVDRFIPSEVGPNPSFQKIVPNFGKEPRIQRLFDGDDGTFYPPTKELLIHWPYGKDKWLLGNPNFRWIWVAHARHEAFWDKDLYAVLGLGKDETIGGIKAERDFSLNYLKVTLPEKWNGNAINFKRYSLTHAEISEIYFVGAHFYQIICLYFGIFGLVLLGVSKFKEIEFSQKIIIDRKAIP